MAIQAKIISSVHNPEMLMVCKLKDHKYRDQQGLFVAEGLRTCATMLQSGMPLEFVCITDISMLQKLPQRVPHQQVRVVSEDVMKKISQATSASGFVAVFKIPSQPSLEFFSTGVVLAGVADPGNMGTLIRTAAAMNVKTVVCIEGADPFGAKVVQASAGTIACVNIFKMTWQEVVKNARTRKLSLIALVSRGGRAPHELSYKNALLVVGSEAFGLPDEVIKACDQHMTIPMPGKTESLNAAVAGSIAMYVAWSDIIK